MRFSCNDFDFDFPAPPVMNTLRGFTETFLLLFLALIFFLAQCCTSLNILRCWKFNDKMNLLNSSQDISGCLWNWPIEPDELSCYELSISWLSCSCVLSYKCSSWSCFDISRSKESINSLFDSYICLFWLTVTETAGSSNLLK